jgi:pilus assembly protein CpaB
VKRRVLTVTLALLLAVLGTVAVLAYVHGADARAVAGMRAVPTLVAQQPIPAGTSASTALHEGLLASQQLPASSVPPNAVRSITPDISSLVMSANVQAGQLLLRPMLVTAAQATGAGTLAIPKGMVAVTIPLCLPEAVAGYVQPGSEVAVFDTYSTTKLNVQENCSGTSQSHQATAQGPVLTRVVLPRVLVLSVGSAPASGTNSGTSGNSGSSNSAEANSTTAGTSGPVLVTMAVNQANAERLILLTETGVSYLALLTPSSHTAFDAATSPVFHP